MRGHAWLILRRLATSLFMHLGTWLCQSCVLLLANELQSIICLVLFLLYKINLSIATSTDLLYYIVIKSGIIALEEI
jgi:hypothetical protein